MNSKAGYKLTFISYKEALSTGEHFYMLEEFRKVVFRPLGNAAAKCIQIRSFPHINLASDLGFFISSTAKTPARIFTHNVLSVLTTGNTKFAPICGIG